MHLIIQKDKLTIALSMLKKLNRKGDELSKLVLIKVNEDKMLTLTGEGAGVTHYFTVGCESQHAGECLIPLETLLNVCASINAPELSITKTGENTIEVKAPGYLFTLYTIAESAHAHEWPGFFDEMHEFVFNARELGESLNAIAYAQSVDPLRFYLNCVYCAPSFWGEGELKWEFVATDSRRLAISECIIKGETTEYAPFLIPSAFIDSAIDIFSSTKATEMAGLYVSEDRKMVGIKCGTPIGLHLISGRTVNGVFPEYGKVIPNSYSSLFYVDRKKIQSGIDAAGKLLTPDTPRIIIDYSENAEFLAISTDGSPKGRADIEIEIMHKDKEKLTPITFALNFRYLLDALKHVSASDCIEFAVSGRESPILIQDEQQAAHGVRHILMPMKLEI